MSSADDIDAIRSDPDPIRRAQRAAALMTHYQQLAATLADIRRDAIVAAHDERAMTYTDIAAALGLTKGRITQIRTRPPDTVATR